MRLRFQFSLKLLLLTTALAAVLLGWLHASWRASRVDENLLEMNVQSIMESGAWGDKKEEDIRRGLIYGQE